MSNAPELSNVRDFLKKVNLLEYYGRFVAEGFDDLTSVSTYRTVTTVVKQQ